MTPAERLRHLDGLLTQLEADVRCLTNMVGARELLTNSARTLSQASLSRLSVARGIIRGWKL